MKKRRLAQCFGILLSASMIVTACGSASSDSSDSSKSGESKYAGQTLTVLGYGGSVQEAMEEAWFKPFEEEYGVTVESVSPPDTGQLTAMGESGKCDYDVLINDPQNFEKWNDAGYIEPLDYSVIDNTNFNTDYYTDIYCAADVYTTSICWNTDMYKDKEAPNTWADLWDSSKRPGSLTIYNYPMITLEMALLADGVPKDEIYPIDVDRALKKLDEIKSDVSVWYDTGEQSVQALTSGEVCAGGLWVGRAQAAKDNGDPVDITTNESIVGIDAFGVMKGCPNKDLAMEFIAYCTSAEAGARFMEAYPYGVVNNGAYDKVSDEAKAKLCVLPEYADQQIVLDYDYWYKNIDDVEAKWNEWMLK